MHLLSSTNLMLLHLLLFTSPCPPFIFSPHSSEPTQLPIFILFLLHQTEMERERSKLVSLFMWVVVAGLRVQNLVIPVTSTSFEEQKNYYPAPDPPSGTPPAGSHGSGGSYGGTTPSHGTPSHGGGYHPTPTPSTPPGGNCGTPPHEPSTPFKTSHPPSHGGYYHSPPTYGGGSPPTYGGGSPPTYGGGSPPTPVTVSPPTTPSIDPGTPSIPTPPFFPAPTPPIGGTCNFWRSHPALIWGMLGWWGTLGSAFGATSVPGFGTTMSLPQALSNTRTDGFGALYREGTASLLNSMVNNRFSFSTKQVRESFVAALGSNSAAAGQAHLFKLANEGHLKPRA
ncbi:LOW QUALITY PROTEIN: protodermal factor 1 [Herrania umbratica]|uniref:LOW QUALITY PROTEIN: protodermal factor 1 n=1 Tax=Herrania umbratica TaxID=108875 RepID=A0A6J0ZHR3_9ROSI|nr:LOW QUALITY PROTEIN: protodermal factor 1 [Herrania umbratica]